jgi:hypothetical protein
MITCLGPLSTIGSYIHLCNWLTELSGLLSIQNHTKITFSYKQPEKILPCIGLTNHTFVILLISSILSMFVYKLSDRHIILTKLCICFNSLHGNTCNNLSLFRCKFIQYTKYYYFKSNGSLKYDF